MAPSIGTCQIFDVSGEEIWAEVVLGRSITEFCCIIEGSIEGSIDGSIGLLLIWLVSLTISSSCFWWYDYKKKR